MGENEHQPIFWLIWVYEQEKLQEYPNFQYFATFYRQLTIVPFEKTDIYLLVLDSEDCARKQIIDRIQTPKDVFLPQKQRKEQKGI